jgi:hypothetical protein
MGPGTVRLHRDYGPENGSGFVTNHTQLLNVYIARYPPNHRHAGAKKKKKRNLLAVVL